MKTDDLPLLLPPPRYLCREPGDFELADRGAVRLGGRQPAELWPVAGLLLARLAEAGPRQWTIRAGLGPAPVCLAVDPAVTGGPEAYRLNIGPELITLRGGGPAGVFYGCQTLAQLLRQYGRRLPCLYIEDKPDFPVRGFMLDISRDRVPTLATLLALVDLLAGWKINHLQLYTEHTFAYAGHDVVWEQASPLTGAEILQLDAYCRERFIDLVPNQASFGHMERWLKHPAYRSLAESPNGWQFQEYHVPHPFSLNPLHPGSLDFISGLYQDLLPHFSSRFFNVNGDETLDLGQGASRNEVRVRGKAAVYFEFLGKLNRLVEQVGRRMLYWADFYWEHPQAFGGHPPGAIALEWGYEADHDFESHTARLAAAGIPFYVCPGTSAWNSLLGRTDNAAANILAAAESGQRNGALGLVNTDWGDNGSLAYLPVSYPGIACGAAAAWCGEQARTMPLAESLSLHAFGDPTGETGRIACDLGNAYNAGDLQGHNSAAPFWFLVKNPLSGAWSRRHIEAARFQQSLEYVDGVSARWSQARPSGSDAALVRDEFANNTAMWQHACRCGLALLAEKEGQRPDWSGLAMELEQIVDEHRRLWLARHRPGGLADSVARLAGRLEFYLAQAEF